MVEAFDLVLENGISVIPGYTGELDIGINNGKISYIGNLSGKKSKERINCKNLHILPGVIDSQVHFREPGATHKDDLNHGMMAAVAGGVTSIFDMPNTLPLTITPEELNNKLEIANNSPWCNYAFYFGGTRSNAPNLKEWESLKGVCGIKIFMGSSTGDLLASSDDEIESILKNGNRIVAVHAEDEYILNENKDTLLRDVTSHPIWRSVDSCVSATNRIIKLAKKCGRKVHILHISTSDEMSILQSHRDIASVEVLPNHLTLSAPECYEKMGTLAQQNPPIREKHHQDALWKAISQGLVDIIGSDHAPHTLEEKSAQYPKSPSGTPGVQTLVPIMLNHVNNGKLSLERLVDLLCYGPHRLHQIAGRGRISLGYYADLTIVDLKAKRTIKNADQLSKSQWTPYDGMQVIGWPTMTIVNGVVAMQDGELTYEKCGDVVKFRETLL
jgi:dihydroorotase